MRRLAALDPQVIRVDALWLAIEPLDMRAGTEAALARVVWPICRATPTVSPFPTVALFRWTSRAIQAAQELGPKGAASDAPTFRPNTSRCPSVFTYLPRLRP